MLWEFQCCVSRDSVLCFSSLRIVFQEIKRVVFQEIQYCVLGVKGCVSRVSVFCFMSFRIVFQEFTTVLLKPLELINNVEDIFLVLKHVPAVEMLKFSVFNLTRLLGLFAPIFISIVNIFSLYTL